MKYGFFSLRRNETHNVDAGITMILARKFLVGTRDEESWMNLI